jgi:O-antigen/teichoic acid export membrane protein
MNLQRRFSHWLARVNTLPLLGWGRRGVAAVVDQGVSSAAGLVLAVLLARWLTLQQYGGYALALALFQFALQFQNGVLLEPMSVLGRARHSSSLSSYLTRQVRLDLVLMTLLGITVASAVAVGRAFGLVMEIAAPMFVLASLLPLVTLPWMVRKVLYVLDRASLSSAASLVYSGAVVTAVLALRVRDWLTAETAIGAMAFGGICTGAFILPFALHRTTRHGEETLRAALTENWRYGRWSTATGLMVAMAVQAQLVITSGILDLAATGVVRAAQNLIQPMAISITAVAAVALPSMASDTGRGDWVRLEKKNQLMTALLTGVAILYFGLLVTFRTQLVALVYGPQYSAYANVLVAWGLIPIVMALNAGRGAGLRARQRPDLILFVSAIWAAVSLGTGIWLTLAAGIWGTTASAVAGYLVAYLLTALVYRREFGDPTTPALAISALDPGKGAAARDTGTPGQHR